MIQQLRRCDAEAGTRGEMIADLRDGKMVKHTNGEYVTTSLAKEVCKGGMVKKC